MGNHIGIYNVLVSLTAALGSLSYGYAITSLGNALSKPAFKEYLDLSMTGPRADYTTSMIALWNCIIYVGSLFGCLSYALFAQRFGRRRPIALAAVLTTVGSALQAGLVNGAMLAVSRFIIGLGIGLILSGVPTYQAEIAPPSGRGLIVGLHASLIGYGTAVASWIGVAFFHVPGSAAWRAPFAIQCIFPLALLACIWFLPESPRWLCMRGEYEAATAVLIKLHTRKGDSGDTFAHNEMVLMKRQIIHDSNNRIPFREAIRKPSMYRRFIIGFLAMSGTQFSGLIVVLTYQSVIYGGLGFSPFMIEILGAVWTVLNGTCNFIGGAVVDRTGRVRLLVIGYTLCTIVLTLLCITTELYGGTANKAGNAAAAAFTFILIVVYGVGTECASFVYTSELFPTEWRAFGISFSIVAVPFWSVLFTAVASPAFANIGAKFYIVFATLSASMVVISFFFFPETKGHTLEQIAAIFGDEVVDETPVEDVLDSESGGDKAVASVEMEERVN